MSLTFHCFFCLIIHLTPRVTFFPYTTLFRSRIQRRGGLIAQQHLGLGGQRPSDADPLLLPARELGGVVVEIGRARLNSSHVAISYAVFCLKKKKEPCLQRFEQTIY